MAQNDIRITFSYRDTELVLPTTEGLTPTTQAMLEDCPRYVRCCDLATSARPTLQVKIPYLGYRKSKGIIALSQPRTQLPSEWGREVKFDQCRLRDQQSSKAPSHLSAMSVPHWFSLSARPISFVEKQIFKRGSSHLSINGLSFMIP